MIIFSVTLNFTLFYLKLDFKLLLKVSSNNWRQIIKLDQIDVCAVLHGVNTFPFFTAILEEYLRIMSNLPRKCPALPGKYYVENVTVIGEADSEKPLSKIVSFLTPGDLPNGIYRVAVNFHAELILSASFICNVEIYNKMNEDVFWKLQIMFFYINWFTFYILTSIELMQKWTWTYQK